MPLLPFVINLLGLVIVFVPAYFLGLKLRRLIPKGKEFLGLGCSIGIFTIFYMTRANLFLSDKSSFINAIVFGVVNGLAFGIGNRDHKLNKK